MKYRNRKTLKKWISVLLILVLCISMMPNSLAVTAEGETTAADEADTATVSDGTPTLTDSENEADADTSGGSPSAAGVSEESDSSPQENSDAGIALTATGDDANGEEEAGIAKIGDTAYETLAEAVAAVSADSESGSGEIGSAGAAEATTITLLADTKEDVEIADGQDIILDLAGHTLTGTGDGSVITVYGSLTLKDSVDGGIVTGGIGKADAGSGETYGGGIYVSGGTFVLEGGIVTANSATNGGGIYAADGASVTIASGTISANTATYGGGIYLTGSAKAAMSAGSVTRNTATMSGGGIYMNGAVTFAMTDGSISYNTASGTGVKYAGGGGVYLYAGASFTMDDGEILYNEAEGTGSSYYLGGGGVYMYAASLGCSFTVNGGSIDYNTAENSGAYGGGIFMYSTASVSAPNAFVMTGGSVSSNSGSNGGGVVSYGFSDLSFRAKNSEISISDNTGGGVYAKKDNSGVYGNKVTFDGSDYGIEIADNSYCGVYAYSTSTSGKYGSEILKFTGNCTVTGNGGSNYGGIYSTFYEFSAEGLTVSENTVSGGSSTSAAGLKLDGTIITLTKVTLRGNINTNSYNGYGALSIGTSLGTNRYITVTDCVFSGNVGNNGASAVNINAVLEPGGIDHSEPNRNNQFRPIRKSQCTSGLLSLNV